MWRGYGAGLEATAERVPGSLSKVRKLKKSLENGRRGMVGEREGGN